MGADARIRARRDVTRLAHRGLGVREFSLAAARAIRPALPFQGLCMLTFDPATLLQTSEVTENGLPEVAYPQMTEIEVAKPDFNKFTDLARAERPAASLSAATEGDLDRSLRQREVRGPHGWLGDELRVALVTGASTWGGMTLLRDSGSHFTAADVDFLASLSRHLAEGVRRSIALTAVTESPEQTDTGLILVGDDNSVAMANGAAHEWMDQIRFATGDTTPLPPAVHAAVGRARSVAAGEAVGDAVVRVRARSGQWLVVSASVLGEPPSTHVAVVFEPARPHQLAPLIADAYGLTDRERALIELVAQGFSTAEIADRLHLAQYTVQDHLKSIFDKAGVNTRGALVARIFFADYAPRLASGASIASTGWFTR
jgi:DNA-binding CsgD family transcriptional regulator